jgi:hypothetical protein
MKNFQNKAKIVKVSKIIKGILFVGSAVWILLILGTLLPIIPTIYNRHLPVNIYLECGATILMVFGLIINLKLFRFFDRLQKGYLFDEQTVGYVDAAGKWWVAAWLIEVIFFHIGHGASSK